MPSSWASGKMRRSTLPLVRVVRHLDGRDAPGAHDVLELAERAGLPVGGGDDVELAAVAAGLQLVEAGPPLDEVVHLEHLDVAAEERERGVDLALGLVVVGRPHLGGHDRLAAAAGDRGPEDALGVAVHRRRVDERGAGVEGGVGDPLAVVVDRRDVERLRRPHADDGDRRGRRTGGAPSGSCYEPTRATNSVMRATKASRWWRSNCSHVVSVVVSTTRSRNSRPSRWSHSCWNVPGGQAALDLVVLVAVAIEVAHAHVDVAQDVAAQVRAPTGSPR